MKSLADGMIGKDGCRTSNDNNYHIWAQERDRLGITSQGRDREKLVEFQQAKKDYLVIFNTPLYNTLREETNNDN